MKENLLCLAVILRSSFENGRDPRGHPVGSPLDLFKPWSMAAAVGVSRITCIVIPDTPRRIEGEPYVIGA